MNSAQQPVVIERRRHLPLEGAFNIRDTGGYATEDGRHTRWGALLRADSLHKLSPAAQSALVEYGVRTVIDLRSIAEIDKWPNVFATGAHPRYVHLPLSANPAGGPGAAPKSIVYDLEVIYKRYIDNAHAEMRTVLATLAAPDAFPALVHCMAGKDRTGLIVALLLSIAGVQRHIIVDDYALTALYLDINNFSDAMERARANGWDLDQYQRLFESPPEYMARTLEYIDERFGSVDGYIRHIGLSDAQMRAIRAALVDAPPA